MALREPIVKCPQCKGEGIVAGPTGPKVCGRCKGLAIEPAPWWGPRLVVPAPAAPKTCGCGASYDAEAWKGLVYLGEMADDEETLELRNCPCGSTLAIVVAQHRSVA